MQILSDLNIAIGIEWELHESLKKAKLSLKGKKKIIFARKMVGVDCIQGFVEASQGRRGLRAGALMVAAAAENALVYHPLGDGQAWVCAVRDGIPLSGFDVVASEDAARNMLTEAMSYIQGADIYGDVPGAAKSLPELLAAVSKKEASKYLLRSPSGGMVNVLLGLVALTLAGGAVIAIQQYEARSAAEKSMMAMAMDQLRGQQERERRLAVQRGEFEAKVAAVRATYWHAVPPAEQYAQWWAVYRQIPLSAQGWLPFEVECDVSICRAKWMRKDARALPSAAVTLPGTIEQITENDAITAFPVPAVTPRPWTTALPAYALADLAAWMSAAKGVALSVAAASSPLTVPSSIEGVPPANLGAEGLWSVTAPQSALVSPVLGKLMLPSVQAASVKFSGIKSGLPGNVEIHGRYRVAQ